MKKIQTVLSIFILIFFTQYSFASDEDCSQFLDTIWEGEKVGTGYQGLITIKFKDKCSKKSSWDGEYFQIKYDWVGESGKIVTPGKLQIKNEQIKYNNDAGSKGTVTINDNRLIWKNVFTGNSYKVDVSKI